MNKPHLTYPTAMRFNVTFSLVEQLIEGGVYTLDFATGTLGTMKKDVKCVKLEQETSRKALVEDVSLSVVVLVSAPYVQNLVDTR